MVWCRKNQATLTTTEKSRFVAAVLALKASGKYDQYVQQHMNFMSSAHRAPAFLPWHREFLRRFELDLRAIDSAVTLPYWDWTVDNSPTSTIWANDFMGPNGRPSDGQVMSGPFAYSGGAWTLVYDGPFLRRRFATSLLAPTLPTPTDLTSALATTPYDLPPYNDGFSLAGFRNTAEGWRNGPQMHNRVHVWVGGSMGPASSPNDPVFFLNHCFEDKLWADWQAAHPTEAYVPITGGPAGHNLNDAMQPWAGLGATVTPASLLDHHALGYAYDTEGICIPTFKIFDDFPTLKFRDDLPTIKFLDDQPTMKFSDDPTTLKLFDDRPTLKLLDDQPTLKFGDDPTTLKAFDDRPTLKFSDDPGTLKAIDDGGPTLKFADDGGGTIKAIDDVKSPGLDPGGTVKMAMDPMGPVRPQEPGQSPPSRAAPFVLATPHHSMAWTSTFPGSLEQALAALEQQLAEYESALRQLEAAQAQGALSADDARQMETLKQEFEAMLAEHDQLARHGGGG
jgi:tyrosinase